jgi:hypothetical protein
MPPHKENNCLQGQRDCVYTLGKKPLSVKQGEGSKKGNSIK